MRAASTAGERGRYGRTGAECISPSSRLALPGYAVQTSADFRNRARMQPCMFDSGKAIKMVTVVALHDVDDVAHWKKSPKRAEFFKAHGMSVKTFVSPAGGKRVGVIIENVPSVDALTKALEGADAAAAMKYDGVHPDSVELYVVS